MDAADALALKTLLERTPVASLGTLHNGRPAVSMVPYALLPAGEGVVIHVSGLATHTQDMLRHPAVGLMVMASPEQTESVLALPRASLQGSARQCPPETAQYVAAKAAYLTKLPHSEELFSFADFSLFIVEPRALRFVAGFGRAMSLTPEQFTALMSAPPES
jgi:putative heme iron utilization protein